MDAVVLNTEDLDRAKRLVIAGTGFWLMGSFVGCTTTASCHLATQERLAVAIARQTPGVGRVVDSIEINDR
jgi:hypothetical protein